MMPLASTVAAPADQRAERFRVQRILWEHSRLENVQSCGRNAVNPDGLVAVKHTVLTDGTRKGGFSGLSTCGSVHACPTCNAKIAARRADELAQAARTWFDSGPNRRIALLTLTVRHNRSQSLETVWDGIAKGWASVTSGKGWGTLQKRHGVDVDGKRRIGWVRGTETMHGANGWHVHAHVLLFLDGDVDLDSLGDGIFVRWQKGVEKVGLSASRVAHKSGDFLKLLESTDQATYLAKATWEVTGGAMKEGKRGNRAPFAILRNFVGTGDLDDLAIWHQWERGSFGRRQLTWSRWLKPWLRLQEVDDAAIAAEDDLDGDVVATITAEDWRTLRLHKGRILRAVETLPVETLRRHHPGVWLDLLPDDTPAAT